MRENALWSLTLNLIQSAGRHWSRDTRYSVVRRLAKLSPFVAPALWKTVGANLSLLNDWGKTDFRPGQTFENFVLTLCDFLSSERPSIRVEGRERAEEAVRQGKGAIVLTSHLGHWELGARILADWGWRVTAVYQPYRSTAMRDLIQKYRAPELDYLAVGRGAAEGVARALKNRQVVALLGDKPYGEEGEPVRLCGRTARLPRGPFLLACRYGTPIIPGFVLREGLGCYVGKVEEALWPQGKGLEAAADLMARAARVLEKYVVHYADQWYRFDAVWPNEQPVAAPFGLLKSSPAPKEPAARL